jgi:hypothetical protein
MVLNLLNPHSISFTKNSNLLIKVIKEIKKDFVFFLSNYGTGQIINNILGIPSIEIVPFIPSSF